ncbi:MAG: YciI family protein [Rhodospirillales bacterium]|nr:YciI family protein [Rhodospirillales bacterium]
MENADKVMTRGPLLCDTGEEQIGSLLLTDVPDMETARQFKDEMPFVKAGLFSETVFNRWRFRRLYDRFKMTY